MSAGKIALTPRPQRGSSAGHVAAVSTHEPSAPRRRRDPSLIFARARTRRAAGCPWPAGGDRVPRPFWLIFAARRNAGADPFPRARQLGLVRGVAARGPRNIHAAAAAPPRALDGISSRRPRRRPRRAKVAPNTISPLGPGAWKSEKSRPAASPASAPPSTSSRRASPSASRGKTRLGGL